MKILIIGYGSIGKRHYEILKEFENVDTISVVSKRQHKGINTISELHFVKSLTQYDYFVIASETIKHYEQLKFLCSKVNNKTILVEKPLFSQPDIVELNNNNVYAGYNLRFHPILQLIKKWISQEEIYSTQINCGQYLPSWRPQIDYKKTYSADINMGGGVLRDLSHELDYMFWLFGDINNIEYLNTKASDLEITSDDIFTAIGRTSKNIIFNINIDYISKIPIRYIVIHTKRFSIYADLINNTLKKIDINNSITDKEFKTLERNSTYIKMHESILHGLNSACNFNEAMKIVNFINKIEFKRE
jgi:predicted dehydrogenase